MTQDNPYMRLYIESMNNQNHTQSKEHFYSMAVNLGQVHNVLGNIISDIIKLMGTLPLKNFQNEKNLQKNHTVSNLEIKIQNERIIKNDKKSKSPPNKHHIPEKMQVETNQLNFPRINLNEIKKNQSKLNLNEFVFGKEEKPKQKKQNSFLQSFYKDLLFKTDKKETSQNLREKSLREGSPGSSSSKTQTAEIVRYNENQKKLAAKNSFDELNKYMMEKDNNQKQYKIKVKQPNSHEKKIRKEKSAFFDLYDSSQSESIRNNEFLENNSPQNYQQVEIDRQYPKTQLLPNDSRNFSKNHQKSLYSPQMKKEKPVQKIQKNDIQMKTNLLEVTRWNDSRLQNMFDVEEDIDDIESTEKKPLSKLMKNNKNTQKTQVQSEIVEYVPRREQRGRKKSDRAQLEGSQCPDCKAFYEAVSEESRNFTDMCQCTSRHKSSTAFMPKHKVENFSQDFRLN